MNFAAQMLGEGYRGKGNFPGSLEWQLTALRLNRMNEDKIGEAYTLSFIGFTFSQFGDYRQALRFLLQAFDVLSITGDVIHTAFTASNPGYSYTMIPNTDSADYYNKVAFRMLQGLDESDRRKKACRTLMEDRLGNACEKKGDFENAIEHYRNVLNYAVRDTININIARGQKGLATVFEKMGYRKSYSTKSFNRSLRPSRLARVRGWAFRWLMIS